MGKRGGGGVWVERDRERAGLGRGGSEWGGGMVGVERSQSGKGEGGVGKWRTAGSSKVVRSHSMGTFAWNM